MLYYEMMLHGDDGQLNAVATVLRNPRHDSVADRVFGAAQSRSALETLKAIPMNMAIVSVYYPALDRRVIVNDSPYKETSDMDLSQIYSQREQNLAAGLPTRLIAPAMNIVPADTLITYAEVHNIGDVLNAPANSVLLFTEEDLELLEVVVDHPDLFGFTCMVLTGLPSSDYSTQFDSRTYAQERVAYATFVDSIIEAKRTNDALAVSNETNYERERKQFTRADGSVKDFTKHSLAGAPDSVEPDDGVE